MQRRYWIIGAFVVIIATAFLSWRYLPKPAPAFPIDPADVISSWSFKGTYTGNQPFTDQANADIAHLNALLGKGQYDDYDIHIGLANDYVLLGDGAKAYDEYDRAIAVHTEKGLGYANLAHLMALLGAKETAAKAYAKATSVEPGVLEYHLERLDFLTKTFPKDTPRLLSAFTDAAKQFGDVAQVLVIEAQWLEGQKRYADAIKALERAKLLSPGRDTSAIDAQIARDKAKL
ncbi:MAG TPA: hypothetical protein VFP46_02710 [Candidatus Paceibacterota bacterium]|nr:hypothetical protein [Candidatus Paceibacterota bacterium]